MNLTLKKLATGLVLVLFAILILQWLILYLTTGNIEISTSNKNNTIALQSKINPKKPNDKLLRLQARGSLSARLKTGDYIVSVEGNSFATSQVVKSKARSTQRYVINPLATSGVEPVALPLNARNIAISNTQITYVDSLNSDLYFLDSHNLPSQISEGTAFQSVSWSGDGFGVGKTYAGDLYLVQNNTLTPLRSPGSGNKKFLQYSVAPNRDIYIANGTDLYRGKKDGTFSKIYVHRSKDSYLLAANDKAVLIDSGDSNQGNGAEKPSITIVNKTGKIIKREVGTFFAALSPDQNYLAVGSSAGGEILNTDLKHVVTIPQGDFQNPVWINNTTLIFSVRDQLWQYDVLAQKSQLIASAPLDEKINELSLDVGKNYVYLTTTNSNDQTTLRRIGLHGQSVAADIYKLQSILPISLPDVLLNFANVGQPTILVRPYSVKTSSDAALNEARDELQKDGFDSTKLQFQIVPFAQVF